jgi:hypothetical protein
LTQANTLWGTGAQEKIVGQTTIERTFILTSTNRNNEVKEFVVACTFKNDRLFGYKIKGPGLTHVSWGPMDDRHFP